MGREAPELAALGLAGSADRARTKIIESLPEASRGIAQCAASRFRLAPSEVPEDQRVPSLAEAVRHQRVVRIRARGPDVRTVHPLGLTHGAGGWEVLDALDPGRPIPLAECGIINISSRVFTGPPS